MNRWKFPRILCLCLLAGFFSHLAYAADPPPSDETKQTVAFVDKASNLIATQGKAAFPQFRVKDGEWWKGDTYVFVYGMDGTLLLNPAFAVYEGQNLLNAKDAHLKAFVQELTQIAKTKGSGWFTLMLPRPGQPVPTQKWAYVKTVKTPEGETLIVGSGFWVK